MGCFGSKLARGDLRLPLRQAEEAGTVGPEKESTRNSWAAWLGLLITDIVASAVFWTWLLYFPNRLFGAFFGLLFACMVLWRLGRIWLGRRQKVPGGEEQTEVPYSCGFVETSGKELFLVATVHISPRAPRDVKAVINSVKPDAAMIELDEERLDRLRDIESQKARQPKEEDLQQLKVTFGAGSEPVTVLAQRALWNAEREGELISGRVAFDAQNTYGLSRFGASTAGQLALVDRGAPNGELGPFAVKAHKADQAGAEAVLVISKQDRLPVQRLGGGTLWGDLKIAFRTRSCGFPRVPVLMLPHTEGERMRAKCLEGAEVTAEFEIMPDQYPRRTLPKRLCQGCALLFSGIGILYGIIGCFDVEVGAEFTEAEVAATALGIPCACIDVDMNRFWARVGAAVLPTPCNILSSFLSWLAFPRIMLRFLFPPRGNVDLVGSMILHLTSLSARTWIAFVVAGFGASTVATWTLQLFGDMSERGAEEAGVVSSQDRGQAQAWMMLAIEAYILPQVCQAVAASRDEAMYRSIVAKGRELNAKRLVAVVGAGHANGILQYARTHGL